MKLKDYVRLKNFMERTTSDSDAEALTALRMANRILAAEGIGWGRVFDKLVTVVAEVEQAPEDYSVERNGGS